MPAPAGARKLPAPTPHDQRPAQETRSRPLDRRRYIPNERYPLPFLYYWLKLGKAHFELLSVGATFAELTKGTFKKISVLTPPQPIMDTFAKAEAPLFQQIENLLRQNAHLQRTRDLLLPRLISGKLSVEDLPIAFPPSMDVNS